MKRYELASVAEAEGYRIVHDAGGKLLHYAHDGYRSDGRTVDPQRIESLLYVVLPGGGCPEGSSVGATGEMMHVWTIDHPGGPFGELDAAPLGSAARAHFGLDQQTG